MEVRPAEHVGQADQSARRAEIGVDRVARAKAFLFDPPDPPVGAAVDHAERARHHGEARLAQPPQPLVEDSFESNVPRLVGQPESGCELDEGDATTAGMAIRQARRQAANRSGGGTERRLDHRPVFLQAGDEGGDLVHPLIGQQHGLARQDREGAEDLAVAGREQIADIGPVTLG